MVIQIKVEWNKQIVDRYVVLRTGSKNTQKQCCSNNLDGIDLFRLYYYFYKRLFGQKPRGRRHVF